MTLNIGDFAPNFTLPADSGVTITLSALRGKKVVLYFYPKDDTSGCTAEACDFRDSISQFRGLNATVIGISKDGIDSHKKFKQKYSLNFNLLSDENGNACELYGTWVEKSMYGKSYMGIERCTFLIDESGVIRAIWRKVSVPGHVAEIASAISGKSPANSNVVPLKTKPAAKKSTAKKSGAKKPSAKKSAAKKSGAKKPSAKKSAAKKSKPAKTAKKSLKKAVKSSSRKSTAKAKSKTKTKSKSGKKTKSKSKSSNKRRAA